MSKAQFLKENLKEDEVYAGLALGMSGKPDGHLVLLPQRPDKNLNWQDAMDWATSVGGHLPTRQEQALLFGNCKPHLIPAWHWSCETHANDASYAWHCYFGYGSQYHGLKSYEGAAVAVRLIPLTD